MIRALRSPLILAFMILHPVILPAQSGEPLRMRADQVGALLKGEIDPTEIFASSFLAQVPVDQIRGLGATLTATLGNCLRADLVKRRSEYAGEFEIFCDKGMKAPMSLAVESTPPHKIIGLMIGRPVPSGEGGEIDDLATLIDSLKALPGSVNMLIMTLPDRRTVAAVEPDRSLAIASAFKLYPLGEAVRSVGAGERSWNDIVLLDSTLAVPAGTFSAWPHGSPVTMHTLAGLMISVSDNSATDALLHHLGRERVEETMGRMGHSNPARNRPFITTGEAFRLQSASGAGFRSRYGAAGEEVRRRILDSLIDLPIEGTDEEAPGVITTVEWFASARDLCLAMDWLREADDPGGVGRAILAINPGLYFDPVKWSYIGFKGGSQTGVLNLTFLLRDASGSWYALSAGWNDPAGPLQEERFLALIQRIINLGPWKTK